jgi:hypothetical protein
MTHYQTAARDLARCFTVGDRVCDITGEPVVLVRDAMTTTHGREVVAAMRGAHLGSGFLDDLLVAWSRDAADIIADSLDDGDDAETRLDEWSVEWPVYTQEGLRWIAGSREARFWVDEARESGLADPACSIESQVAAGATAARRACASAMLGLVQDWADEAEAAEEAGQEADDEAAEREADRARMSGDE